MHVKRPFEATHWRGILILLLALLLTATACAPRTTTPAPAVAAGAVDGTGYRFLRWNEGLAILIWYDFRGDSGSSSTSSGGNFGQLPTYTIHGYAESEDGERFEWEVETTDGETARFRLAGEPYDLSQGTLFIVTMEGGRADVTQLEQDLSDVEPNHASTYHSEEHGFALRYPPDVEPGLTCPTEAIIDEPLVTFRLTGTRYYSGTNLLDACATIRVGPSEEARESCTRPRDDHEGLVGQEDINGIPFTIFSLGGVATGHIYDVTSYCTVHADTCYEITLFVHYANIGVYEPGTVAEFDEEMVRNKLTAVLRTFHFVP